MAKCKSCGAEIIFINTVSGKSMPCDATPVPYWERLGATGRIVTPNGEVLACEFEGNLQDATGMGFVPHWAMCTKADRHRR